MEKIKLRLVEAIEVFDIDLSELLDLKKVNPNHSHDDYEIKNEN